jgi:hypothetical protein
MTATLGVGGGGKKTFRKALNQALVLKASDIAARTPSRL